MISNRDNIYAENMYAIIFPETQLTENFEKLIKSLHINSYFSSLLQKKPHLNIISSSLNFYYQYLSLLLFERFSTYCFKRKKLSTFPERQQRENISNSD